MCKLSCTVFFENTMKIKKFVARWDIAVATVCNTEYRGFSSDSDTNREPVSPKQKSRKIKFSSGCVFLAACAAGDKEEVLRLLQKGADINTANVDGLTALHQACIDDNLDMVEFLVEHGADVNRGDNEGWTPLHATASCGFQSIAKYLLEHAADVAAVNNDGELALDIAEEQSMEDLLQQEIQDRGVNCDEARSQEERLMLRDAREWLNSASELVDTQHPKTGATALHVAAAKGYIKVMNLLLQGKADVDKQDNDGWTPMHAAAHWGQFDAAKLLADNLADMDMKNIVGQTAFDVADTDMFRHLEDLKKRQNKEELLQKKQNRKRAEAKGRHPEPEPDTPSKVKRVEVEIEGRENNEKQQQNTTCNSMTENAVEKKNRANSLSSDAQRIPTKEQNSVHVPTVKPTTTNTPTPAAPTLPPRQISEQNSDDITVSWRRSGSVRSTRANSDNKNLNLRIVDNKDKSPTSANAPDTEVTLRRTQSFQSDPKNVTKDPTENVVESDVTVNNSATTNSVATSGANSPTKTTVSPASSPQPNNHIRRSFVPPVRDEESETQRKAHAKRVRETRRSTQGVTLDEIKSAEQLVKKKNQTPTVNNNNNEQPGANGDAANGASVTATITTGVPTIPTHRDVDEPAVSHERRPSWRLRVDNGSKFKLEDATKTPEQPSSTVYVRRPPGGSAGNAVPRPSSAPVEGVAASADATVTIALRRPKSQEDKDQDKENDARNAQATLATQAAIQRRRRPKRRSTGVVHVDMDEIDPDKQDPGAGGDYDDSVKVNHQESGSEKSSRSRLGSASDLAALRGENGELDYKKMYEQAVTENDRLKDKLRKSDEELRETKQTLEKINTVTSKNSLSELEKRERRAMERKLSEMEEELKQLEALKTENQRLKDENGALIRVISKLSK
ncbi:Myosin binding subunit [Carabus blaptoides fortunei]